MSKDLRTFLEATRAAGPQFFATVKKPLSTRFEPSVLQEKLSRRGRYPVLFCPKIEGSRLPLVTNVFGSYELLGLALDVTPQMMWRTGRCAVFEEYRKRRGASIAPKYVPADRAPVRQTVLKGSEADLGLLPVVHHAEGDAGKYISIGVTFTRNPDTGIINAGVYRQQVTGRDRIAMYMGAAHHGSFNARRYAELKKPMPVVTVIGHHPAVAIGAASGTPQHLSELDTVGGLLGEPLEVIPGLTVDLPVPAAAEIVVEGIIDATQQYIFASDQLAAFLPAEISQQAVQTFVARNRHQLLAQYIVRRIQRKSDFNLREIAFQFFQVFQDAYSGHGDMAGRNSQSVDSDNPL